MLSYGIRKLLSAHEPRLEMTFLVALFVCVLGLVATANGKTTHVAPSAPIDWRATTAAAATIAVLFAAGLTINKLKKWK